jgi:hypothetical protein
VEQAGARPRIPTEPAPTDLSRQRRGRLCRRVFVTALVLFLALGAAGFYGVRGRTASATGGGYELVVHYAGVSRPGLATPWSFEVRRAGGFPDGLTVAVASSYFDAFDENGLGPTPVEETSDGERTVWRFAPQSGDVIVVDFDARIEPGVQFTRVKGRVEVLAGRTGPVAAAVDFRTVVMP